MWIQKIYWQQWLVRWKTFSILTFSLSAVWRRPWYIAGESWVQAVLWVTTGKMSFLHLFQINIRSVSWQCLQLVFLLDKRSLRQRKYVKEPNPMLHVSKSTRLGQSHHAASNWSTLERAQQLFFAWQGRPPGGILPPHPVSLDEKSTFAVSIFCSITEDWLSSREQDGCILSRNILSFDAWWMY